RFPPWRRWPSGAARNSIPPPRKGAGVSARSSARGSLLAAGSGAREQLAEYGVDFTRGGYAPHCKVRMSLRDLAVACPGDALHRGDLRFGHHLDVGEVLADAQDVLLQHRDAALHVVIEVVPIRRLRSEEHT